MAGHIVSYSTPDTTWEAFRDTFRTLYLVEDQSLDKVKDVMKMRYNFIATKAQFELRFNKWGFRKNLTKDEWNAVTYKIHKRKREDKESEVCIHGLPMKTRKTMKAMSRYGSTSRIMVEGGSGPVFITDWLSLTVKTALSPQTPIGITVCTPELSFAVLPKGALSPKPVNYMPNLMDTLPFMRFKSTFVMDASLTAQSPGSGNIFYFADFDDTRTTIMSHFQRSLGMKDLSKPFGQEIKALIPGLLSSGAAGLPLTDPQYQLSFGADLLNVTLFLMSNNFLSADTDVGTKIYTWISRFSNAGFLKYLLSIGGPTIEALEEQLFKIAIEKNDACMVKTMLDNGLDISELRCFSGKDHVTPLQRACTTNSLEVVKVLLYAGADVNRVLSDSLTPMTCAVGRCWDENHHWTYAREHNVIELVQVLLDAGANVSTGTDESPLSEAVLNRYWDLVTILLSNGADPNILIRDRGPCETYTTPLIKALIEVIDYEKSTELVQALLDAGADANDFQTFPPLYRAIQYGHLELVTILLSNGADANHSSAERETQSTPLMEAVLSDGSSSEAMAIVRCLLRVGADVNAAIWCERFESNATVLDHALNSDLGIEMVQFLLEQGARVTNCCVAIAAGKADIEILKFLVRPGIRVTRNAIANAVANGSASAALDVLLKAVDEGTMLLESVDASPSEEALSSSPSSTTTAFTVEAADEGTKETSRRWALTAAIQHGNRNLVQTLSASGVRLLSDDGLEDAIRAASLRGDTWVIRFLLDDGSPYRDVVLKSSGCALCYAIERGQHEITEMLLETCAHVECKWPLALSGQFLRFGHKHQPPLSTAILQKDVDLSLRLLTHGAAVDRSHSPESNKDQLTSVLPAAVALRNYSLIQRVISAGGDLSAPDQASGKTALAVAVENRDLVTMRLLVDAGADVSAFGYRYLFGCYTPLAVAVRNNDLHAIRYLLAHGADVDEHALIAAVLGRMETMQLLLGARVSRHNRDTFGCRAMQHAIKLSDTAMMKALLSSGVDLDLVVYDCSGTSGECPNINDCNRLNDSAFESAFETAIRIDRSHDRQLVRLLLHGGADPSKSTGAWNTPLLESVDQGSMSLVKILVAAGADLNPRLRRWRSRTPLQRAVELKDMNIILALMDLGADVNAHPCDEYGATALQLAAIKGCIGVASVLIEKGADVNAAPARFGGRTALEGACEHGRIDMLQLLLNAGAQVTGAGNAQYERARSFATEYGHIAVRRLLEKHHAQQVGSQSIWVTAAEDVRSVEDPWRQWIEIDDDMYD